MDGLQMREKIKEKLAEYLGENKKFVKLPTEEQSAIIRRIERDCFNKTVEICEYNFIDRRWDNQQFLNRYSEICATILENLDANGSVGSNYFADKIASGEIDPRKVCSMDIYELCPEASRDLRADIEFRRKQKVEKKYTSRFSCPKCGAKKAETLHVQTRALDEISSLNLKCLECDNTWFKS